MVADVCNRESVELTEEEFNMLQVCRFRTNSVYISCEECPARFVCYTSKANKYAGKPISWILGKK